MSKQKVNYEIMLSLIDEVFATRNDPEQIQVTPDQMKKLSIIHKATLSELSDENGPLIWVLIIPTLKGVMDDFLQGRISEKGILDNTPIGVAYEAIYLCSATTLIEARGKGNTKQLCLEAIKEIKSIHPIQSLFVWPFTNEGKALAKSIASASELKLFIK